LHGDGLAPLPADARGQPGPVRAGRVLPAAAARIAIAALVDRFERMSEAVGAAQTAPAESAHASD
jgi:hypothetical protein